jgi:hypothetical protein
LTFKKISKNSIHSLEDYLEMLKESNKSPYDILFKDFLNLKENISQNHFISSLINQAYIIESKLIPLLKDYEDKIESYYNILINLEKNHQIKVST